MIADQDLDLCGLNCPQHVMRCKAALVKTPEGKLLHVVLTDPRCHHDIQLLVHDQGDRIEHTETRAGVIEYWIRRHERSAFGGRMIQTAGHTVAARFMSLLSGLRDRLANGSPAPAIRLHM